MSIDNVEIPGGILAAFHHRQSRDDDSNRGESEAFDIAQVARQRARTLSISLDQQTGSREDTLERLTGILQVNENVEVTLQQGSDEAYQRTPSRQRRQRPTTIHLGGIDRSGITGLHRPSNAGLRSDRTSSLSFEGGQKRMSKPPVSETTKELENSYIFQSLRNYQLSEHDPNQDSSVPSVFLARNGSTDTASFRKASSQKQHERSQSDSSQFANIDVVRRASIAVENAVEKVKETITGALRRSSLQEVYEKAKIRQAQLKRSAAAQISFQYTFYLLMLATVYFVFIGYPLWNGLVLTIYYLFDMKLVIPAGTAVFLGVGFL